MKIQGVVNASSQSEVLRSRMTKENLTHGQTVRADIPNVRVGEPNADLLGLVVRRPPVFFCNVGNMRLIEEIDSGDGGSLPDQVIVKGLKVDSTGMFDLENALITSNFDHGYRRRKDTRGPPPDLGKLSTRFPLSCSSGSHV